MTLPGIKKKLSREHEEYVARKYAGRRSPSSGASPTDQGDVRVAERDVLIECKGKFGERTGEKPVRSTLVTQMEKITDEAYAEGKDPVLALRFYMPDSPIADNYGYVDLVVRFLEDDVA
jgi:hypothetical protein